MGAARGLATRSPSKADVLAGLGLTAPRTRAPQEPPRFSVVVPVFRPPLWALERCVASVLDQTFPSFELCLCDDGSDPPRLTAALSEIAGFDPRIKVTALEARGGISAATNGALVARERRVRRLPRPRRRARAAGARAAGRGGRRRADADVLYSDEDKIDETGALFAPSFKPGWSPDIAAQLRLHLPPARRAGGRSSTSSAGCARSSTAARTTT